MSDPVTASAKLNKQCAEDHYLGATVGKPTSLLSESYEQMSQQSNQKNTSVTCPSSTNNKSLAPSEEPKEAYLQNDFEDRKASQSIDRNCSLTLHHVVNATKDVTDWKSLGIELGIRASKLDEISVNYPANTAACRNEMFQFWLQSDMNCSWEKLCNALTVRDMGVLANEIRIKYGIDPPRVLLDIHQGASFSKKPGAGHRDSVMEILSDDESGYTFSKLVDAGKQFLGLKSKEAKPLSNTAECKDYYTVVLLGKTGQGKSSVGNKLLGINGSYRPRIKEWAYEHDRGLLKCVGYNETFMSFAAASSYESVTSQCQMLSNEDKCIRVLDVPGFGDSRPQENLTTIQVNAKFVNAIIEVQNKMNVTYNRVIYFLPFRGILERIDGYFLDELKLLFHYFGKSIFQCMVMIATQEKRLQKYPFQPEDFESLTVLIKNALTLVTGQTIEDRCPPIVYVPLDACPENLLDEIQMANVLNDSVLTAQKNIPVYSGDDNWEEWIERFELIANDQFKDDDKTKVAWFKEHLACNVKCTCLGTFLPTDDYETVKQKVQEYLYSELFSARDVPEPYSGEGDENYWERWIEHFEKKTSQRKLSQELKLQWLLARLVRGAQQMVNALHDDERWSYSFVKEALQKQMYTTCFEKRGKTNSEEVEDYATTLMTLAKYAYPDVPVQEREQKVLNHLAPYLHPSIQPRKWKSVDEAITINCAVKTIKEEFTNDRSEGWHEWLKKFESKCAECCTDKKKYLLWFESRLNGRAMNCYSTLPKETKKDYEVAKNGFQAKLYLNSFDDKCNSKPVKESAVRVWAKELSQLVMKAYPNMAPEHRDREVIKKILLATEKHFGIQPETVKEAVNFVCAIENIPTVFTGAKGWHEWFINARVYLSHEVTNMSDREKLRCIQTRLSGNALEIYQSLTQCEMTTFEYAIASFQDRLFHHWLKTRRKEKSELWDKYVQDMCSLGEKVYIKETSEQLVLEHILNQVDEHQKTREWKSLSEAVNTLVAEIVLPPFSNAEKENWKMWKAKLENVIKERALDKNERLIWLSNRLAGDAKEAFDQLHCNDYDSAVDKLEKMLYVRKFKSRTKKLSETWEELHKALRDLAADCYSSESEIESGVFQQIRSIMSEKFIPLCVNPLSAEDAVFIVTAQESVPDTFSGTENWDEWIGHVNAALSKNKIVDNAKQIRFLQLRLTGTALNLFTTVQNTYNTYMKVIKSLEIEIIKEKFKTRSKNPGETWAQFIDDLRKLGNIAYVDGELNECLKNKILSDINVGDKVKAEKPQNVEEAIIIAEAKDAIQETFTGDVDQWDKWCSMFERKSKSYDLDEGKMLTWFRVSLTGDTKHIYQGKSYDEFKNVVEVEIFKKAFEGKKKDAYEVVDKLATTLLYYAGKAFPGKDVRRHALDRLKEIMQTKELEYDKLPLSTFEEAVITFTALEEMNYKLYKEGKDWELWLRSFEKVAERNGLVDSVKIQWLKACVTGKVLDTLEKCPTGCMFESVKSSISNELEQAKEEAKLSLISCTKCSGKGNDPTCHTEMVYPSETKSGFKKVMLEIKEFFITTDKVCLNCEKGFGNPGCTSIGDLAKHDCFKS